MVIYLYIQIKNKFDKKTVEALSLPKKAINKTPAQLAEMFDKMLDRQSQ